MKRVLTVGLLVVGTAGVLGIRVLTKLCEIVDAAEQELGT